MFHDGGIYCKKSAREEMRQSESYLLEQPRLDHKTGEVFLASERGFSTFNQ
jgi:hypothetical protein